MDIALYCRILSALFVMSGSAMIPLNIDSKYLSGVAICVCVSYLETTDLRSIMSWMLFCALLKISMFGFFLIASSPNFLISEDGYCWG
jgi:hypothetical protein